MKNNKAYEEKNKKLLRENEQTYGQEIKVKYGESSYKKSYQKFAFLMETE